MRFRATTVLAGSRLNLDEVSALCVRRVTNDRQELLAVGDEDFVIHRATVQGGRLSQSRRLSVRNELPAKLSQRRGGSEWESIAADGSGRVFVLRESTATVFVFSPGLGKLKHTIHLDLEASENIHARHLLDDPNAGPEGMLLLKGGHLVLIKQRDPIVLIEFGRKADGPEGLSGDSYLPSDQEFGLSDGQRTTLQALASWELDTGSETVVKTANDLAVDGQNRLHSISSKSGSLFELEAADARGGRVSITNAWALHRELEVAGDRKAEGLTFIDEERPLVALDVKDKASNCFLLERLERENE